MQCEEIMEKKLLLKAEVRANTGTKSAVKVRKQGRIPAVVYGHKQEPVTISLDAHDLVEGRHQGHRLVDIQMGKEKETMIFKELQYDHLGKDIIHVDLMRVDVTEMVRVTVPIELKGAAKGAHEGGIIEKHTDHLEVECRATDIPETIVVSIKDMAVGDTLHASDIELPEGVKMISSPSTLLVTCGLVAVAKSTEELEEEVPAAPEVISEVKKAPEEETSEEQSG
jgi:large subunit ribosomal protein L25